MARILVVDDDEGMADATRRILVKAGYDVAVCYEGRVAIEEAAKTRPDLILMDMMMPKFSGDQTIKELKKVPELAQIPIIILTGLVSPKEYMEMTRISIEGKPYKTLCKPYEAEELLRLVKESLWRVT
ncbi:MAG: response regulator [Candidatus Omnitrophica bacterium]|nr:response regulator [Candidatus Omnitrophota bacterium]MDE2009253.1 response regulator [Candidatus Omnitrophota bacterium]MDE2213773.1 response regulator [Candidatus Omnitrophota bacterium]MDE2230651.1 response regulator [Candidatus Omnitrophota bacterium]